MNQSFNRYVVVGISSNVIIYTIYMILTHLGMEPKFAMSLLYGVGALQTFVLNSKWSFRFSGATTPALLRYVIVYMGGWVINFIALILFVDQAKMLHQYVQGLMIFIIAIIQFVAQRYWVFR